MSALKSVGRAAYAALIETPTFRLYFVVFFGAIIVFGLIYSFLPSNHGWAPQERQNFWSHIWEGLYFSVVTITSLGYGDLQPRGFSRILAGIEVVLGLTLIGLMIAKLTSERVSHFVSSIYVSDTQRNLIDFASKFHVANENIHRSMNNLSRHLHRSPSRPGTDRAPADGERESLAGEIDSAKVHFTQAVTNFMIHSNTYNEYLLQATDSGKYLQLISEIHVTTLVSALTNVLSSLNRSIVVLTPLSDFGRIMASLMGVPKADLSDIAFIHKRAARLIADNSESAKVKEQCEQIQRLCDSIGVALRQAPEQQAPDQVFRGDEPMESQPDERA